jgi:hypothetical protein
MLYVVCHEDQGVSTCAKTVYRILMKLTPGKGDDRRPKKGDDVERG